MSTVLETVTAVQTAIGVTPDGKAGSATRSTIERLFNSPLGAPWPPEAQSSSSFILHPSSLPQPLQDEYLRLWNTMVPRWNDDIRDEPALEAIYQGLRAEFDIIVRTIRANRERYEHIASLAGGSIPWDFIAIIHNMECGLNFSKHLHNGDPLTGRTRLVPAGRPTAGHPPFTFEASAVDALTMRGKEYHLVTDWSIPALLHRVEGFNGYGYRKYHPDVLSPYLWSGSNHYTRGKYIADGQWSATAVSKQLGTALILKALRT